MADPYKSVRQDVLREQIKKAIDIHSHYAMLTSLSVILVVIGYFIIRDLQYSGVGDSHSVGIAGDILQQGLVVQTARFEKPCNTSLGEYSGKFLRLSDFRKHQSSGLFESHDLVVVLQPKDRVLKKRRYCTFFDPAARRDIPQCHLG